MMHRKLLWLSAVLVGAAMLVAPTSARADFQLKVSADGGSTSTTYFSNDGGTNWYSDSTFTTKVGHSVSVDGVSIFATSTSATSTGKTTIDVGMSGNETNTTYNLKVWASLTDALTQPPPQSLSWKFTSSTTNSLTERGDVYVSSDNTLFSTSNVIADSGSLKPGDTGSTKFNDSNKYSVNAIVTLTGTGDSTDQVSNDLSGTITPTPAPAALALVLMAVPALGVRTWLRRRHNAAVAV